MFQNQNRKRSVEIPLMHYECVPFLSDKFRKNTIIYEPDCVKQYDYSENIESLILPDDNGEYYQKLVIY